jgi:hypothetical protein
MTARSTWESSSSPQAIARTLRIEACRASFAVVGNREAPHVGCRLSPPMAYAANSCARWLRVPPNPRLVLTVRRGSLRSPRRPAAHPQSLGGPSNAICLGTRIRRYVPSRDLAINCRLSASRSTSFMPYVSEPGPRDLSWARSVDERIPCVPDPVNRERRAVGVEEPFHMSYVPEPSLAVSP